MSWTLIAKTVATPGSSGGSTTAINTTGADLLVVGGSTPTTTTSATLTDSAGNTWSSVAGASAESILYYCFAPKTSATHTVDFTLASAYPTLSFLAYSGSNSAGPIDGHNATNFTSVTSAQPGSITTANNGDLIVNLIGWDSANSANAISVGTIQEIELFNSGANYGGAIADFTQVTAGAINPTWTWTTGTFCHLIQVAFPAGTGGGSSAGGGALGAGAGVGWSPPLRRRYKNYRI